MEILHLCKKNIKMQEFVFLHQHSVRTEFERKINSGQIKKSERD